MTSGVDGGGPAVGASGGGDADGGGGGGPDGGERGKPGRVETVVIAVSTLFTLALFGYVVWQATAASTAVAPTAEVVEATELPGGDVRVEVAVENHRTTGLSSVTVAVHCTVPPAQITFEHVPVDGRRVGSVVCPPGSGTPRVTLVRWIDA